jgi:hypothetical protein
MCGLFDEKGFREDSVWDKGSLVKNTKGLLGR